MTARRYGGDDQEAGDGNGARRHILTLLSSRLHPAVPVLSTHHAGLLGDLIHAEHGYRVARKLLGPSPLVQAGIKLAGRKQSVSSSSPHKMIGRC